MQKLSHRIRVVHEQAREVFQVGANIALRHPSSISLPLVLDPLLKHDPRVDLGLEKDSKFARLHNVSMRGSSGFHHRLVLVSHTLTIVDPEKVLQLVPRLLVPVHLPLFLLFEL